MTLKEKIVQDIKNTPIIFLYEGKKKKGPVVDFQPVYLVC